MGMRPSFNINERRELRTWVKAAMAIVAGLTIAGVIYIVLDITVPKTVKQQQFVAEQPGRNISITDSSIAVMPPKAVGSKHDYKLAMPQDPIWSKVIAAPFPEQLRAQTDPDASRPNAAIEVTVIGGYSTAASLPLSCELPLNSVLRQFGATTDGGESFVLLEVVGAVHENQPLIDSTPAIMFDKQCEVGTLFRADHPLIGF